MPRDAVSPLTVGDVFQFLGKPKPDWPPDVFAFAGAVLLRSGAYSEVIRRWPPKPAEASLWAGQIEGVAKQWRESWSGPESVPKEVQHLWGYVLKHKGAPLSEIRTSDDLVNALLELVAIADEACYGVGVALSAQSSSPRKDDKLYDEATILLLDTHTLCRRVHRSRLHVLPKLHTPRSGITLRSLTHNLALCPASNVIPNWFQLPHAPRDNHLNVLLVPWPNVIVPSQFRPVQNPPLLNIPPRFGFFSYNPDRGTEFSIDRIQKIYQSALDVAGRVDLVILPELSVTPQQHEEIAEEIVGVRNSILIAGVASERQNQVVFTAPYPDGIASFPAQSKHHRWLLTGDQVSQYGLGATLDPSRLWWEDIEIPDRTLTFVSLNEWLTVSVLICEDLARQDPVAEMVRAVGPNLLIALLMDGPQLKARWPARYATVFADDPGSSVLTITSLGMTRLCCPPGRVISRRIGLWKDTSLADPSELELPENAEALLLCVTVEEKEEWTADGRSDGHVSCYPVLAGVHRIPGFKD